MATDKRTVELILEAKNEFSKAFDELNNSVNEVKNSMDSMNQRSSGALDGVSNKVSDMNSSLLSTVTIGNLMATSIVRGASMISSAIGGIIDQVKTAVSTSSQFEQWTVAFETMLGGADNASRLMEDIKQFAKETPFELPGLVRATKSLAAYGIEQEKLLPNLKAIGDIAAAVGMEKLPQLILAFGQIRSKGRLTGEELRQLRETGLDVAQMFGITNQELMELVENKAITFEDVEQGFINITSEGGKFFDMMKQQSQTFEGIMSNIRDSITILGMEIINQTGVFDFLKSMAESLRAFLDENQQRIIAIANTILTHLKGAFLEVAEVFKFFSGTGEEMLFVVNAIINAFIQLGNIAKIIANTLSISFNIIGTGIANVIDMVHGAFNVIKGDLNGFDTQINQIASRTNQTAVSIYGDYEDMNNAINSLSSTTTFDIKTAWDNLGTGITTASKDWSGEVVNDFDFMAEESNKALQKMQDQIEKLTQSYERQVEQRKNAFQDRLEQLIFAHREKKEKLEKDIKDETRTFEEEMAKRQRLYEETIANIKEKAAERKEDVIARFEEETKQIKLNLMRQLSEAHDSDATLIQLARNTIAEKERERDMELAKIEQDMNEELLEEKNKNDEKIADLQKTHEEKLAELQTQLEEEMAIQAKHSSDFLKLKDKEAKDDITLLKENHKEQLEELKKYHKERLEEIKKQYDREQKAKKGKSSSVDTKVNYDTTSHSSSSKDYSSDYSSYLSNQGYNYTPAYFTPVPRYQTGGFVSGVGEQPAILHGGEMVLTPTQTKGLLQLLSSINEGVRETGRGFTQQNQISMEVKGDYDVDAIMRRLGFRYKVGGGR